MDDHNLTIGWQGQRYPIMQWIALDHRGFAGEVADLIRKWQGGVPSFTLWTSGSTGNPRPHVFSREFILARSRATARALGLQPHTTALLALPVRSAGGFMVLMRALTIPMHLIVQPPSTRPFAGVCDPIHFAAFTPHQVAYILQQTPEALASVQTVIIGGAPISPVLEAKLRKLPNTIYHTYGMTETLSHIALRNISAGECYYRPLPDVQCSITTTGTLQVYFPAFDYKVVTTDRVRFHPQGIEWLGRSDFVINSGGVKLSPEVIERKLASHPQVVQWMENRQLRFYITSAPHPMLGRCVALVYDVEKPISEKEWSAVIQETLSPYERPRRMIRRPVRCNQGGKVLREPIE